jgi:hypothetical protein
MPKFVFKEVCYSHKDYVVRAENLEKAQAAFEQRDSKGVRKTPVHSNKVEIEFLQEITDEAGNLVWCEDPEVEISNGTALEHTVGQDSAPQSGAPT